MSSRLAASIAAVAVLAASASAVADDTRRSGFEFMSPALQALQRDDHQNPAMLWVQEGAALWARPAANGKACATCHAEGSERGMAAKAPRLDAATGRPLSLAGRIDQCRQRYQGESAQSADGPELLALGAYLSMASRGLPLVVDNDPRAFEWASRGEALWRQRMGQLDLSCAQCHDQNAGRRLGGAAIPQAHPTGYPSYRLEWQTLGSLSRRLRNCVAGVRAEPFAPDADEWLALEMYLARRAAGMAMEGPSVRP
jgi:sulfur-oxidizing protein SoxA